MSLIDGESRTPGVWESLRSLWKDFRTLLHDHMSIALLEVQRAAESLISMMVYGLLLALLLASVWFAALGLLLVGLLEFGIGLAMALLVVLGLNLFGAAGMLLAIRYKSNDLKFPVTMGNLLPEPTPEIEMETVVPTLLSVDDQPEILITRDSP